MFFTEHDRTADSGLLQLSRSNPPELFSVKSAAYFQNRFFLVHLLRAASAFYFFYESKLSMKFLTD